MDILRTFQRFNPPMMLPRKIRREKMGAKETFLLKPLKKFQSHATGLTWIRNYIVLVYQKNDAQSNMSFSLLNNSHKSEKSTWMSLISVFTANPASTLADERDSYQGNNRGCHGNHKASFKVIIHTKARMEYFIASQDVQGYQWECSSH